MSPPADIEEIANSLLRPHNLLVTRHTTLQSLWAGYGQICRLEVRPIDTSNNHLGVSTLILKLVTPPLTSSRKSQDEGHLRKIISYQVEQHFYQHLAPFLPQSSAAVARCYGTVNETAGVRSTIAMVLEDLRLRFPVAGEKRGELNQKQIHAALEWLANFHGFWWKKYWELGEDRGALRKPPLEEAQMDRVEGSVWLNGGYTYLATRRKEYANLTHDPDSEWRTTLCHPQETSQTSLAEKVAKFLSPSASPDESSPISRYETLIHGDVKSENLFITADGSAVAFFDFQYVGLGLGVCDLAKLFTCSVPENLLVEDAELTDKLAMQEGEKRLLKHYLSVLKTVSGKEYEWDVFVMHWQAALVDWLRFQASWGFWGNTEWLEARVRYITDDTMWREWLEQQ